MKGKKGSESFDVAIPGQSQNLKKHMKILITGERGFIGSYMSRHFNPPHTLDEGFDVTDEGRVTKALEEFDPDVVIHCAAIKDVNFCQQNSGEAFNVNVLGTQNIAKQCAKRKLILMSTDMVFSGTSGKHKKTQAPNPNTVYGQTKMAAEEAVRKLDDYAICRTSAVYGWTHQRLFNMWLYEGLKSGKTLDVYDNHFNSPTYVANLCEMIEEIMKKHLVGTFHTCGPIRLSKLEFAVEFAETLGFDKGLIKPCAAKEVQDLSLDVTEEDSLWRIDDVPTGLKRMNEDNRHMIER